MKTTTFLLACTILGVALLAAPIDTFSPVGEAAAVGCEPDLENLERYAACETGRCDLSGATEGRIGCRL